VRPRVEVPGGRGTVTRFDLSQISTTATALICNYTIEAIPFSREVRTMPIYEFECKKCHNVFTLIESFSEYDRHAEKCPKCQSKEVSQLISSATVRTSKKS